MRSLKNFVSKSKGFTIVELLIVIVVIGILAALVIVTFSGIQQRARDTERQTDINAIQSHLEAYYADAGVYPTLAMLQDSAFRAKYMKGLDAEALKSPGTNGVTIADTTPTNGYSYVPKAAGGTCPDATGSSPDWVSTCDSYTLTADLEASTTNYVKKSS